jgi:hypothetical protein
LSHGHCLASEGWSHRRAEIELENFERLVAARAYIPTPDAVPTEDRDPPFGTFARTFLAEHAVETARNTRDLNENLLEHHLAPYFERIRLSQITWSAVDSYKKQRLMLMQRFRAARGRAGAATPVPSPSAGIRARDRGGLAGG